MFPIRDNVRRLRTPVVVYGLIAVNALVFLYELGLGTGQQEFMYRFGLVPKRVMDPEWANQVGLGGQGFHTFLSSMFLHANLWHVLGNMWMLWIFGDNVEDRMGRGRFLVFYLSCGLIAALSQFLVEPSSDIPMVGASGAVAGIMGAYLLLYPHARVQTLIVIVIFIDVVQIPAYFFLGLWIAFQFLSGAMSLGMPEAAGGIAFWAHIGGFLAGIALLKPMIRNRAAIPEVIPPPSRRHQNHFRGRPPWSRVPVAGSRPRSRAAGSLSSARSGTHSAQKFMAARHTSSRPRRLTAKDLRWKCPANWIPAAGRSPGQEDPLPGLIGQDRALDALEMGLAVGAPGYNVFVSGISGTEKTETVRKILDNLRMGRSLVRDHVFVHNFAEPMRPKHLDLPQGGGHKLRNGMERLGQGATPGDSQDSRGRQPPEAATGVLPSATRKWRRSSSIAFQSARRPSAWSWSRKPGMTAPSTTFI